jgi:hypothetical protein
MLLPSLPVLLPKGVVWLYPLLRALTEHRPQFGNMIGSGVRGQRARGIDQTALFLPSEFAPYLFLRGGLD